MFLDRVNRIESQDDWPCGAGCLGAMPGRSLKSRGSDRMITFVFAQLAPRRGLFLKDQFLDGVGLHSFSCQSSLRRGLRIREREGKRASCLMSIGGGCGFRLDFG